MPSLFGRAVSHYQVERSASPWEMIADKVLGTSYTDTNVASGRSYQYRVRAVNVAGAEGPWSPPIRGSAPAPTAAPEVQTVTVVRTETVTVAEDPFAYFGSGRMSRAVAENSPPGSPVGAPVTVIRNSGNNVLYSLEGEDAALFRIERDSGQILVGQWTVLDYESDRTSYSVEVVADPSRSGRVRTVVDIEVVDVAESASVSIMPAGQPQVGEPLTATLTHGGGEPVDPRWQWYRSTGGPWAAIEGAEQPRYTPTERDAGARLRVIATYGEPDGSGEGVAGAVTQALAGEPATAPVARHDTDGDGGIDLSETLAAIAAYFRGELDYDGVMAVIGAYYAG